jgi:hypothetical protein
MRRPQECWGRSSRRYWLGVAIGELERSWPGVRWLFATWIARSKQQRWELRDGARLYLRVVSDGRGPEPGGGSEYTVVLRASSSAYFLPEEGWEHHFSPPDPALGTVRTRTFTRWVTEGSISVPRELVIEVKGCAVPSLGICRYVNALRASTLDGCPRASPAPRHDARARPQRLTPGPRAGHGSLALVDDESAEDGAARARRGGAAAPARGPVRADRGPGAGTRPGGGGPRRWTGA